MPDLNELYQQYRDDTDQLLEGVHRYALAKARTYQNIDAEAAAQDIALRVWETMRSFDPERGDFRSWVAVLTRNYLNSCHRNGKRVRVEQEPEDGRLGEMNVMSPAGEPTHYDITKLPEDIRKIAARLVLGYTKQEIADQLGCSTRTVEREIERHIAALC